MQVERATALAEGAAEDPGLVVGPLLTRCAILRSAGRFEEADVAMEAARKGLSIGRAEQRLTAAVLEGDLTEIPADAPLPLGTRLVVELLRWSQTGRPEPAPSLDLPAIEIGPDGRWFRRGDAEPVDLSRRGAMRRILIRLVRLRVETPGAGLDQERLQEVGWPQQMLHPESGRARVYTAVRSLRRLGLEGVLVTREEGYLLDPDVALALR